MAKVLNNKIVNDLKKIFSEELEKKVKLLLFKVDDESVCEYCNLTRDLLEELKEVDERVELEVYDFNTDKDVVEKYGIERVPAIVILDEDGKDYGVRFYGIPSGHEFSTLIDDIVTFSKGPVPSLSAETIEQLKKIDQKVKIQVFVTPTCPYCPRAVLTAHHFALVNENIVGEMIEANEFMDLSMKFGVSAVPHIVVNEEHSFVGALPEANYLNEVLKALK
ncbi:MAG: hypothetical protein PWQ20_1515 [Thermotogaceae bacterium]|jgi:glutaredoxin-like protein|nr:hypothetical protein [Thermotogaceae bacterium]MDN5338445.1 hypothetical protein [Thermotogaceae bacterium]